MSTGSVTPFTPNGQTIAIAVSTTSQAVSFEPCDALLLFNNNTSTVFVAIGTDASPPTAAVPSTSTPGSMPIPPNSQVLIGVRGAVGGEANPITQLAAVTTSGGADLYVTPGLGTQH